MNTKGKAWKLKNKGFTLIEMIVTVAIIAIFSGVVVTFIGTGSGVYRNTSSNSKVQMETQETFDKIEDLIIDANRSLYYANGSGSEIGAEIRNDIKEKGGINSTGNKTFIASNEYENGDGSSQYIYDVLDWQAADGKIYYSRREYTAASSTGTEDDDSGTETLSDESGENLVSDGSSSIVSPKDRNAKTLVERSVLATGILDFRADVSKVESDKIVRFQFTTENGKKQIQTLHSVSLRNNVDLKKPSDAFNSSDATNVGIKIINAPEAMDPGESTMLAYGLTGNGSIDPTTVTWLVVDNETSGSFPPQDHTNSRLTISENGSGYIKVKVTAVSTTGQTVESQVVTIKINATATPTPTPSVEPKKLIIKTPSLLLGANNQYTLSEIVQTEMTYEDGSVKTTGYDLAWSIGTCNFASITNGVLTIDSDAGTSSKGKITLTATETISQLHDSVEITVARIDIRKPSGTYKVGQDRPEIEYVYLEAGYAEYKYTEDWQQVQPINNVSVSNTDPNYKVGNGEVFLEKEVGNWSANVSYNLADRGGIGTVQNESAYQVQAASEDGDIIISGGNDILSAGSTYYFGYLSTNLQHIYINKTPDYSKEECDLTWSVKGNSDPVTDTHKNNKKESYITIGENEQGFLLSVEMKILNNHNENEIIKTYHASINVKIAHPKLKVTGGLQKKSESEEIYGAELEQTYKVGAEATISYLDNPDASEGEKYTYSEYDVAVEKFIVKQIGGSGIGDTWKANIRYNHAGEQKRPIVMQTQDIPGLLKAQSYKLFEINGTVEIETPTVEITVHEKDNKHEIKVGDPIELWATLKINGKETTSKDYNIWWEGLWDGAKNKEVKPNEKIKTESIPDNWNANKIQAKVSIFGTTYESDIYNIQIGNN